MVIFQRAGDLPFVLYGGDGQCFGSQFFRYMMDVLFILLRVVGTGAIDQQTAGFQRVPDVVDDAAPASGTERDVRDAPFACTVGIFAKHTFAGTGHVGNDGVHGADPFRHNLGGILLTRRNVRQSQTRRTVFDQGSFVGVYVAGDDTSFTAHGNGRGKALASRRGAAVQHVPAGFRQSRAQDAELCRRVLHIEQPFPERRQQL